MEQQNPAQNEYWSEVLDIQGYRARGSWTPGTEYYQGDVVIAHKRMYVSKGPHVSDATNAPPESAFVWFAYAPTMR